NGKSVCVWDAPRLQRRTKAIRAEALRLAAAPSTAPATAPACPLCDGATRRLMPVEHTTIWRCGAPDCTLEFAHPQMDDSGLADAYRQCYYPSDPTASHFAGTHDYLLREWFRYASDAGRGSSRIAFSGARLLDYGCGDGTLLRVASEFGA